METATKINQFFRFGISMLFCISGFSQTNHRMEQKKELIISPRLIRKNNSEYSSYFRKIEIEEAKEKRISVMYNYIYSGKESLSFLGYKINSLLLVVKNNFIHEVYFEVPYSDFKIFKDLIAEYGYPGVVRGDPPAPDYSNPEKTKYERYREYTWGEGKTRNATIHITNIINKTFEINEVTKLWIKFRCHLDINSNMTKE